MKFLLRTPAPPATSRRGYTLIELAVVIALMGTLLSLTGLMLHSLLAVDVATRDHMRISSGISNLELALRQDARTSTTATINLPNELTLTLSDGSQVIYTTSRARVTRQHFGTDSVVQHRDEHRLPGCELAWRPLAELPPGVVELLVDRPAIKVSGTSRTVEPKRPLEIRASLWSAPGRSTSILEQRE